MTAQAQSAKPRKRNGSFGCRPCRSLRRRYFESGLEGWPKSWKRRWIIARIIATPAWADFKEIRKVYVEANRLTELTGIKHVVDHIIPLQHPRVCGLHVHNNLAPITEAANSGKGNYFCPEQADLFEFEGQLKLWSD